MYRVVHIKGKLCVAFIVDTPIIQKSKFKAGVRTQAGNVKEG